MRLILIATLLFAGGRLAAAAGHETTLSVAAAANFVHALDALNTEFKRVAPAVAVTATVGASGSLFAQLKHGAPFDVFLSADTEYAQQVVAAGLGSRPTLRVFATGRLVLWTMRADLDVSDPARAIRSPAVRKLAIAQPRTAPYGRAAKVALENIGVWRDAAPKLVIGESSTQTAQFVETGNADAGLVALSLVLSAPLAHQGRWREIPAELYASVPLDHAGVLTTRGTANVAARQYLEFLHGVAAKKILRDFGYRVPD